LAFGFGGGAEAGAASTASRTASITCG
jgi:hypothetical protein